MALTQAQWETKIRTWVPEWWFEEELNNVAAVAGLAAVLADLELAAEAHVDETFITKATAPFIDAHGAERNVERLVGELNPAYAPRIRNIINQSNRPALESMINAILVTGQCKFIEHYKDRIFAGFSYLSRKEIFTDYYYRVFSIVVAKQIHSPYSFLGREDFAGREDFMGTNESALETFQQIVAAVNKNKAFGVLYRLVEQTA